MFGSPENGASHPVGESISKAPAEETMSPVGPHSPVSLRREVFEAEHSRSPVFARPSRLARSQAELRGDAVPSGYGDRDPNRASGGASLLGSLAPCFRASKVWKTEEFPAYSAVSEAEVEPRNTRKRTRRKSFGGRPLSKIRIDRETGIPPASRLSTAAALPVIFRVFRVFRGSIFWSWEGHPDIAKG